MISLVLDDLPRRVGSIVRSDCCHVATEFIKTQGRSDHMQLRTIFDKALEEMLIKPASHWGGLCLWHSA